jgi:hypothetical protein
MTLTLAVCLEGTINGHQSYGQELYGLLSMLELGQASRLAGGQRHQASCEDGSGIPEFNGLQLDPTEEARSHFSRNSHHVLLEGYGNL